MRRLRKSCVNLGRKADFYRALAEVLAEVQLVLARAVVLQRGMNYFYRLASIVWTVRVFSKGEDMSA